MAGVMGKLVGSRGDEETRRKGSRDSATRAQTLLETRSPHLQLQPRVGTGGSRFHPTSRARVLLSPGADCQALSEPEHSGSSFA